MIRKMIVEKTKKKTKYLLHKFSNNNLTIKF